MLEMMMKMITTTNIITMIKIIKMIKKMAAMIILKTISPPGSRSGGQIATWQGKAPLTMPATKQPDVSLPFFLFLPFNICFCVFFKQTKNNLI